MKTFISNFLRMVVSICNKLKQPHIFWLSVIFLLLYKTTSIWLPSLVRSPVSRWTLSFLLSFCYLLHCCFCPAKTREVNWKDMICPVTSSAKMQIQSRPQTCSWKTLFDAKVPGCCCEVHEIRIASTYTIRWIILAPEIWFSHKGFTSAGTWRLCWHSALFHVLDRLFWDDTIKRVTKGQY